MIYFAIIAGVIILAIFILVWLRKLQFDQVHRNFLDLVDHFGGKVVRGGFAVRPRYGGIYKDFKLAISISSEQKSKEHERRFYISVFLQSPAGINYTILSKKWMEWREDDSKHKRITQEVPHTDYLVEVADENILQRLDFKMIEKIVKGIDPFAYALVSRRGVILERLSGDLIKDTEFAKLNPLIEGVYELTAISEKSSSPQESGSEV